MARRGGRGRRRRRTMRRPRPRSGLGTQLHNKTLKMNRGHLNTGTSVAITFKSLNVSHSPVKAIRYFMEFTCVNYGFFQIQIYDPLIPGTMVRSHHGLLGHGQRRTISGTFPSQDWITSDRYKNTLIEVDNPCILADTEATKGVLMYVASVEYLYNNPTFSDACPTVNGAPPDRPSSSLSLADMAI